MVTWKTNPLSPDEAVARARSMLGKGVYVLGAGGYDPSDDDPQGKHYESDRYGVDCSGFVNWCWGVSRVQRDEMRKIEYLNTTFMVNDARRAARRFVQVELPSPGDAVVYGWYKKKDGKQGIGHVGLVVSCEGGTRSIFERIRVIHCASPNQKRFGYAIAETNGGAWNSSKDSIFVRPKK